MPSSSPSASLTLALVLYCLIGTGCGAQLAHSLVELSQLQADIVKQYGEAGVNVNLNNSSYLTVTFINSPLNERSPEDRAKRAAQTAVFVKEHYGPINQIEEIWVGFVRQKNYFIFAHYTEGLNYYGFDRNARPLVRPEERHPIDTPDNSTRPIVVYSPPPLDQTEVRIPGLQLSGTPNQGLSVEAHFTVPGDATGVRRAAFPRSVTFEFASYWEKSLFPGEPKIAFLADGKAVFETAAQFSTSKNQDGLFSEFVVLEVPYPAFRRLTTGKKVVFKLGDQSYELTEEQVQALREMTAYVRD